MNEIPGNLLDAMEQYSRINHRMANDAKLKQAQLEYDQAVEAAKRILDAVEPIRESYESDIVQLEDYIKAQVLELGRSVVHNDVKASHRSGYERVTWDNKKITSLIMENPVLAQIVVPARKVTEVAPSVSVSINPQASLAYTREDSEKEQSEDPLLF
jgi:hypothetical protein